MVKFTRTDINTTATIMVQFPPGTSTEEARTQVTEAGGEVACDLKDLAGVGPFMVVDVPGEKLREAIAHFESRGAQVYENPPIKPL